jgi:hypothetical protein
LKIPFQTASLSKSLYSLFSLLSIYNFRIVAYQKCLSVLICHLTLNKIVFNVLPFLLRLMFISKARNMVLSIMTALWVKPFWYWFN